jgi:hypothetical protein
MDAGREPRTPPFLWDTVWVYEIRIPKDPHFERISTNEFIFDAVIICDQRSGSEIITEEGRYTFRRYPGALINTGLQTKKIHQRKINPGESAPTQGLARTDRRRLRTALVNGVPIVLAPRRCFEKRTHSALHLRATASEGDVDLSFFAFN